jgi:signal transduction histidine kinase
MRDGSGVAVTLRPVSLSRRDEALGLLVRLAIARTSRSPHPRESMSFLAALGRRMLPAFDCAIAVVPADNGDVFRVAGGAGRWAERRIGEEWPVASATPPGLHATELIPLYAAVPVRDGRALLGAIALHRRSPEPVNADELGIIEDFAALIAVSLQRAELREAAQRTSSRLQTALDVAIDLAASLEPRHVIKRLLLRAGDAVGADRGTLIRVLGDELVVEDSFDRRRQAAPPGGRGRVSTLPADSLVRAALEARKPVLGEGYWLPELPTAYQEAVSDVTRRLAFPLVLGGNVVAVLTLHRREGPPFGAEDLETLQLFGGVAALALRNSWLFAEAEEAGRAKTDFLNMGAHELRTPLTVISGYLSMLREGALGPAPEGWRPPLDMLAAKTTELSALVEDLLLASRMETGRLPLRRTRFDLREAVEAALDRALVRAATIGGRLQRRLPDQPVEVEADPEDVGHILNALVANALVYSDEPPEVVVTLTAGARPRIRVEDQGQGVPEDERDRIFERFYRVQGPAYRHRAGTGLGLYVARELARRQGGDVVLEWTSEGEGSRFALELPAAP